MYCMHCGEKIDDDSLYCQYCGKKVNPIINTTDGKYNWIINTNTIIVESKSGEYLLGGNNSIGFVILNKNNRMLVIDTLFEDVFTHGREFVDSVLVKKDGKWGLINPLTGKLICDFIYDKISQTEDDYNNGSGEITVYSNGLCGRIDSEGKVIVPIIYEEISSYGMVKSKGGLWGVFENGQEIEPCKFSFNELFERLYVPPCV